MLFVCDLDNTAHIARHHVTAEEAEQVMQNDPLDLERQIWDYEERFVHVGETNSGRILFVIVTIRKDTLRAVKPSQRTKPSANIIWTRKRNFMAKILETLSLRQKKRKQIGGLRIKPSFSKNSNRLPKTAPLVEAHSPDEA